MNGLGRGEKDKAAVRIKRVWAQGMWSLKVPRVYSKSTLGLPSHWVCMGCTAGTRTRYTRAGTQGDSSHLYTWVTRILGMHTGFSCHNDSTASCTCLLQSQLRRGHWVNRQGLPAPTGITMHSSSELKVHPCTTLTSYTHTLGLEVTEWGD